jgi:hypothetical protein
MKNQSLIKLAVIVNFQLAILLGLVVFYGMSNRADSSNDAVVLGTDIEIVQDSYKVSVCGEGKCVWLSSNDVEVDGVIDRGRVYQEVLDKVFPFFEKEYGGKEYVYNNNGGFIKWKEDIRPDLSNVFDDVYISFRSGLDTNVELEVKQMPGTDGRVSAKYIEIDDSQQTLYVWENGEVIREIKLSGVKSDYAVYGIFPIIDKGLNPISPSGSYMPYWMAFYYSARQDSWYGLHGLIWWYDDNGNIKYEPESNIGIRKSNGCIRMLKEDAKYLYDMFDKGDLILIHK